MLFRQLEYFVALARERHFAQAAAACYVSQPALSEAIRKLERELGVPLVNRGRAFEGLTPEGERLLLWARRILADHDALKQEVAAMQSGLNGQLRLAVIPAVSTTAALLVEPFCSAHPLASVRLETRLTSADISERIRRFEFDAGIVNLHPEGAADLHVLPLYSEQHVLVASRELVPDAVNVLSWSEAAQLPLCMLNESMRGRQVIDEALDKHGLAVDPRIETDSIASIYSLANTGRWAGIVPRSWFLPFQLASDIRLVPLTDPFVTSSVGLVTNAARPGSVIGRALADVAARLELDELLNAVVLTPAGRGSAHVVD
jgi:DNA-binding transcriptional LysR family regulator